MSRQILKDQFEKASEMYPPSKYVSFIYKNFSKTNNNGGFKSKLSSILMWCMLLFFAIGFIGTVLGADLKVIATSVLVYTFTLAVVVFSILIGILLNRNRLNKIRKELGGISKVEYTFLVNKFYKNGK